jgi:hypothetical protein
LVDVMEMAGIAGSVVEVLVVHQAAAPATTRARTEMPKNRNLAGDPGFDLGTGFLDAGFDV